MKKIFAFLILISTNLFGQNVDIESYYLKNGMKVIFAPNKEVPSICFRIFFKVGGKHETPGTTGISHLFEHMMFNGSAKYKPGMFDKLLEENGGYSNGSTWNDFTNYWEEFNSDKLELVFDLEADRMKSLKLDNENLEQERYIVMEERRLSVDNNPQNKMEEQLYATAFVSHLYRQPVIGWMEDLKKISLEDCKYFYKTYYSPNNSVLILTGDFDKNQAKKLITKYFEKIPKAKIPEHKKIIEPEQKSEKIVNLFQEVELPSILIGYKSCSINDSDFYAMDLIANILGYGLSSRFKKILSEEKKLITEAYASQDQMEDKGLFKIYAQARGEKEFNKLLDEIDKILEEIKLNGVNPNELEKAKNTKVLEFFDAFKTNQALSFALGYYEILTGDYNNLFKVVDNYSKVSSDDIKRVANKYFNKQARTIVISKPVSDEK
ncbi:MAG: insulinase family protein [Ignavibacteria bacterium]|nr:insulinase family protein [Ignavibacteria bacterium]